MSKSNVITKLFAASTLVAAFAVGNAAVAQTTSATPPPSGTMATTAKKPMAAASNSGTNSGASKLPDDSTPKSKGDGKGG